MSTLRLARAVALSAVLAACGDRPAANPAQASPAAEAGGAGGAPAVAAPSPGSSPAPAAAPPDAAPQVAPGAGPPQVAGGGAAAPGTPPAPAALPDPGTPAAPVPAAPAPVTTVIREAVAIEPGGATVALAAGTEAVIDPGARFRVVLLIVSDDARLLLLDGSDAVVAGEGAHELGQATRLTFAPSAPLVPGRRYTLRVDGATTRELHAASGAAFAPASLTVLVAGSPPAPAPKEQPATRRKRRGR